MSNAAKITVDAGIDEDFCGRMTKKLSPQMAFVMNQCFLRSDIRRCPACRSKKKNYWKYLYAYPAEQRYCLAILQDMQRRYNYIPREGMEAAAEYLGCPLSTIYSMATFYKALSLKPKGKHVIKLCDGTACHIRGSSNLRDGIVRYLGIGDGETTEDGMFSLELVNCLGSCALAPVMVVDDQYYGKVTMEKLPVILDSCRKEEGVL